jgi:hypothetical protein
MQKNNVTIEIIQFLTLLLGLSIAAIIFQQTVSNLSRFGIIVAISVLYILWGYWHHAPKDRMLKMILLEYSLVAGMIILLAALGLGIIRFF